MVLLSLQFKSYVLREANEKVSSQSSTATLGLIFLPHNSSGIYALHLLLMIHALIMCIWCTFMNERNKNIEFYSIILLHGRYTLILLSGKSSSSPSVYKQCHSEVNMFEALDLCGSADKFGRPLQVHQEGGRLWDRVLIREKTGIHILRIYIT